MEKIRAFVDNMFLSLPDTPEVQEAKAHILEGMLDRYEALLGQGKNENEAFGTVIGEFGSMEELRRELGLGSGEEGNCLESPAAPPVPFPREEYEVFRRRYPVAIAGGVVLCILAIVAWLLLDHLAPAREAGLHHVALFLIIAGAVGLFVYFGVQEDHYETLLRMNRENPAPKNRNEDENPVYGFIMLSATVIYLILGFCLNLWHPGWIVFPGGAALCCLANAFDKRR